CHRGRWRGAWPASPGCDAGLRTHSYSDVTYAYSTHTLARATPRHRVSESADGSTLNVGASDGAITPKAPNFFVMWNGEPLALASTRTPACRRYSSSAASSDAF